MEKSLQWMTLQELRDELDRTRPAWDELADLVRSALSGRPFRTENGPVVARRCRSILVFQAVI